MLEKAIKYVSPSWALNRAQTSAKLQAFESYKGASLHRRQSYHWTPFSSSADSEIAHGTLDVLRTRSQDLYKNHPLGKAAIDRQVINVIGTGLWPEPVIEAKPLGITEDQAKELEATAKTEWAIFSQECDLRRTFSFNGLIEIAFKSALLRGDVFVNTPMVRYPGQTYSTKLQLIEADRVSNPNLALDTVKMMGGIEKGANGDPAAYHVLDHFPGELLPGANVHKWRRLQAFNPMTGLRQVMHLSLFDRPDQSRGLPVLTPILEPLKMLDRYRDAELMAAVVGGMFTVFVRTESDMRLGRLAPRGDKQNAVEPGAEKADELHMGDGLINYLMPDESIDVANPGRPNANYEPFVVAILKEIGAGLSIPFEELILFYQSSFSAARASIIQAWKLYLSRRVWLASMLLNHVWQLFWQESVALGRIPVRDFSRPDRRALYTRVLWNGPTRGAINELQSVQAAALSVASGFSDQHFESQRLHGLDGAQVTRNLINQNAARIAGGLAPLGTSGTRAQSGKDVGNGNGNDQQVQQLLQIIAEQQQMLQLSNIMHQ